MAHYSRYCYALRDRVVMYEYYVVRRTDTLHLQLPFRLLRSRGSVPWQVPVSVRSAVQMVAQLPLTAIALVHVELDIVLLGRELRDGGAGEPLPMQDENKIIRQPAASSIKQQQQC